MDHPLNPINMIPASAIRAQYISQYMVHAARTCTCTEIGSHCLLAYVHVKLSRTGTSAEFSSHFTHPIVCNLNHKSLRNIRQITRTKNHPQTSRSFIYSDSYIIHTTIHPIHHCTNTNTNTHTMNNPNHTTSRKKTEAPLFLASKSLKRVSFSYLK